MITLNLKKIKEFLLKLFCKENILTLISILFLFYYIQNVKELKKKYPQYLPVYEKFENREITK